ncbi:acyl-CoA synthetase [Pollutimonas nitritireducens]|uniref:Acyl-CoA synthetase n=1 Tax=Pollutimonas nitritireducens TaxID=2045209 RepID=A0A2N4UG78_9BURK|nr:AMP-binding protein [Pollutimonas nitritireducens]PLC54016.1 acyl-CoA synthetase [Pollutimonas nitritireducens]
MSNPYEHGLDKQPANYSSLTPVSFLERSAHVYPDKVAVIDDDMILTYQHFYRRCRRMASALTKIGIKADDTVTVLCFNSHELLESHYSIPMVGAVLNAVNTRVDAATLAFIIQHGESRVLLYDTEFEPLIRQALAIIESPPLLVAIVRDGGARQAPEVLLYEDMVAAGDPDFHWDKVDDEWNAITLNYTSGTTGNPKGAVYHHRGAYLAAMSNAMAFNLSAGAVYLWTLPMFHCNGWCYTWAVTAVGGTHVCLRKVQADAVIGRIRKHGVTHMCGAPIVLNLLLNDFHTGGQVLHQPVQFGLGGAAPPSPVIGRARQVGFHITHLYGLTESYGPSALCVWHDEWNTLPPDELARKMARQGVGLLAIDALSVARLDDGTPAPADGQTLGELLLRGNTLMKGYLKNASGTQEAFQGGWFHTGDIAVMHPDGYVEIKDRAKDIIISGGENISSQEIEEVLYSHPRVFEAAVVAMADEKWGEVPCAFVALKDEAQPNDEMEFIAFCRARMASFKAPKHVVFGELPKTSTGKIRKNILRDTLAAKVPR